MFGGRGNRTTDSRYFEGVGGSGRVGGGPGQGGIACGVITGSLRRRVMKTNQAALGRGDGVQGTKSSD